MSSYLDYTIEVRHYSGPYVFVKKSNYDIEEDDSPNPYVLKGVLWDEGEYTKIADIEEDGLTPPTLALFAQKIEEFDLRDVGQYQFESKVKIYNSEKYPYKYRPNFEIKQIDETTGLKEALIKSMDELRSQLDYKFNDTLVAIDINGIDKHLETFIGYMNFNTSSLDAYEKLKKEILEKKSILPFLSYCKNIFEHEGTYYWVSETPYATLTFLRDYPIFKNEEVVKDVLLPKYGIVHYINPKGKEVIQYELKRGPKISTYEDVKKMVADVDKNIKRVAKSLEAENLAKNIIADYLKYAKEEDLQTELGKQLQAYTADVEDVEDYDYLAELKSQKSELETLLKEMGEMGRFIWDIS